MRYPIAIEPGDNGHASALSSPICPAACRREIPSTKANSAATQLGRHACGQSEFQGWIWAIVEIDPEDLSDAVERVNITLPRRVLTAADRYAAAHRESCSGLLARAALETMARD